MKYATWRTAEDVAAMYNSPMKGYWEHFSKGHLHFGYWDETNASAPIHEAVERANQLYIARADVGPVQRWLDAGCGNGALAVQLARAKGCRVDGVTVASAQYEMARRFAEESDVADRVAFHLADMLEPRFDPGTFDGVWFIESIFHMGQRKALQAVAPLMRRGAQLIIVDFPLLASFSDEQMGVLNQNWCANEFLPLGDYPALLRDCGFEHVSSTDLTQNTVVPGFRRWLEATRERKEEMIRACGRQAYDAIVASLPNTLSLAGTSFGYAIIEGRKV
ncbi:MAG TPA: methyltransferase domain-containing protein [Polyangiaceae bacterium]|nr:methyltransferase domain-containing protein [Polyangiaceae bacterium]